MLFTVFTPTYNRGYTLKRLYRSLIIQSCRNFEWVVVDDGSTDDTRQLMEDWMREGIIQIRYFYQENTGKPGAHNRGVKEAKGNLFCCVDSDDYLRFDAVETVLRVWNERKNKDNIGILAFRINIDGTPITSIDDDVDISTLRGAYKYHGLKRDTMLVFETSVLKKYSFPIIEGEKFIPEGYLYNKLDKEGTLIILREGLYICEYQKDGYTANVDKLIFDNYKGYILHLNTRIREIDDLKEKVFDSIRYDAISIGHSMKGFISKSECKLLSVLGLLPGYILYRKRYRPIIKKTNH